MPWGSSWVITVWQDRKRKHGGVCAILAYLNCEVWGSDFSNHEELKQARAALLSHGETSAPPYVFLLFFKNVEEALSQHYDCLYQPISWGKIFSLYSLTVRIILCSTAAGPLAIFYDWTLGEHGFLRRHMAGGAWADITGTWPAPALEQTSFIPSTWALGCHVFKRGRIQESQEGICLSRSIVSGQHMCDMVSKKGPWLKLSSHSLTCKMPP